MGTVTGMVILGFTVVLVVALTWVAVILLVLTLEGMDTEDTDTRL